MVTAQSILKRPMKLGYMVGCGSGLGQFRIALINTNVLDPSPNRTSARNKHWGHEDAIARLTRNLRV